MNSDRKVTETLESPAQVECAEIEQTPIRGMGSDGDTVPDRHINPRQPPTDRQLAAIPTRNDRTRPVTYKL